MAQTSINIQPCKVTASERHNKREKVLSYVRPELSHLNEWYNTLDVHLKAYDARLRKLIKAKTGRACQAKSHPLHEATVVIRADTTIEDIKKLADAMHKRWGFHFVQLAVHKDEGHWTEGIWKPNLHAHMVFDKIDHQSGKTIKTTGKDTSEMQDLCAQILGMERGKSSNKKHLNALDFKIKAQEERAAAQNKAIALQSVLGGLAIHAAKAEQKRIEGITNTLMEAGEKRLNEIADLKQEKEKTAKEVENLRSKLSISQGAVEARAKRLDSLRSEISGLQGIKDSLNDDIDEQITQLNERKSEAESLANVVEAARSDIHGLQDRKELLSSEVLTLTQEKQRAEQNLKEFRETATKEKNRKIAEIARLPQDVQRTSDMLWNFIYSIWDGVKEAIDVLCKYLYLKHINVSFDYEETAAINNAMKNAQGIESRKAYGKQLVDLAHAVYPGYEDDSTRLWEIGRKVEEVATRENRWFQGQNQSQGRGY